MKKFKEGYMNGWIPYIEIYIKEGKKGFKFLLHCSEGTCIISDVKKILKFLVQEDNFKAKLTDTANPKDRKKLNKMFKKKYGDS